MKNVDVNIGRRCNLRCRFCLDGGLLPEQRQWVPPELALEEIQRGFSEGCRSLGLLGGEPTVYPHLEALIRAARQIGYERVAIITNGVRLGEAALCDVLVGAGLTRVAVSIHAHRAAIEDALTGRPGGFEAKVAGLRRLAMHRDRGLLRHGVAVNTVLTAPNVPHLLAMARFFRSIGVDDLRFNFVRPWGRVLDNPELVPRYPVAARRAMEVIAELERGVRSARGGPAHVTFGDFPLCVWPWEIRINDALRQRYFGERHDLPTRVAVFGAPRESDPDLQRFDVAERRRATQKSHPPVCQACAFRDRCEGPWTTYLELYGADELVALDSGGLPRRG